MFQFTAKARSSVRDIDPQNDLTFVRIRTKKHEIMIAPGNKYSMVNTKHTIWLLTMKILFTNTAVKTLGKLNTEYISCCLYLLARNAKNWPFPFLKTFYVLTHTSLM